MKRFLFVAVLSALLASSLSAQYFGLRIGVNSTNAKFESSAFDIETDGETNLMMGLFFDVPLGTDLISIQPELNYLNRGFSTETNVGNFISYEQTVAYVDVGALLKLNFGREEGLGFYVGAGPYFSYALNGTVTEVGEERDIDFDADRLNRGELQLSGVAGLTFDLGLLFFVEGRYNTSLSNLSDDDAVDITQRSFGINGGIMVPIGN
ncbi:porin family protein [Lewinella sp. W8]|uniref:porin family protein n=1 Tax=Lewinella sp. W8 TaxID=2528208 RepID=UPI0010674BC9|nr:porin family protein [Lewinella sp. W8]MTB53098.1 outer membrane beta-barrel protein [Lewinella sp. W8]